MTPWSAVFSKAPTKGQSIWARRRAAAAKLSGMALTGLALASAAWSKPLPQYATLRMAPVTARGGPGESYRALWRYATEGLPLQVVQASGDWRRVCDPEGGLSWVRAEALEDRRTVMRVKRGDLAMRAEPGESARAVAVLAARATAEMLESRGDWRRITVDHATGWIRSGEVWGGSDAPQCQGR